MLALIVNCSNLLLAALLTGAMFGASLVLNPAGLSGPHYVALQQRGIRTLHPAMPILGLATLAATLAAAVIARGDDLRLYLLAAAAAGFLASGLITRLFNMPINAVVMTWSPSAPPQGWTGLRDAWWRWHLVRLLCGLVGFCALALAAFLTGSSL